jgi:hypothetical protein
MKKYIQELRLLRIVMICFTLVLAILSRFAGDEVFYAGWKIIPTLIAPAIVPILFFVIWLDVLMSWVFKIDAPQEEKPRFVRVIAVDLVLVIVLTASWFGYFSRLVS